MLYSRLFMPVFMAFSLLVSPVAANAIACHDLFAARAEFRYPSEILALDMTQGHTIQNLSRHLREKLGDETFASFTSPETRYVIVQGPARSPLKHLRSSSVEEIKEISNPQGAFNVVKASYADGKTDFVFTNVNGESRLTQVLSYLRLGRVEEKRISLVGRQTTYENVYRKTFEKIGHIPDMVIFGFANTAVEIMASHSARMGSKILKENEVYADRKWKKPAFHQHELLHMGVQVFSFANGKKVWVLDNEYGDRAGVLARSLVRHGVKRVLLLGTAGAVRGDYRVGDRVSPELMANDKGVLQKSPGLELVQKKSGVHTHVDSPILETKAWLQKKTAEGIDFVDIELQKVAPEFKDLDFAAYFIISDVIGSKRPSDYTQWTDRDRVNSRKKLSPVIEAFAKLSGIDLKTIEDYRIHKFQTNTNEAPL